eukprot:15473454-Alexandrium_andersonii.AAC.1
MGSGLPHAVLRSKGDNEYLWTDFSSNYQANAPKVLSATTHCGGRIGIHPGTLPTSAGAKGPSTARFASEQLGWDRAPCPSTPPCQHRGHKINLRHSRETERTHQMDTEWAPDFEPTCQQSASVELGICPRARACVGVCVCWYVHPTHA